MSAIYHMGKGLGKFCFNVFGRLEVTGRENVPRHGPLIIVANHLSFTDPPVLVCSFPRNMDFLGKKELFANPASDNDSDGWQFTHDGFRISGNASSLQNSRSHTKERSLKCSYCRKGFYRMYVQQPGPVLRSLPTILAIVPLETPRHSIRSTPHVTSVADSSFL